MAGCLCHCVNSLTCGPSPKNLIIIFNLLIIIMNLLLLLLIIIIVCIIIMIKNVDGWDLGGLSGGVRGIFLIDH